MNYKDVSYGYCDAFGYDCDDYGGCGFGCCVSGDYGFAQEAAYVVAGGCVDVFGASSSSSSSVAAASGHESSAIGGSLGASEIEAVDSGYDFVLNFDVVVVVEVVVAGVAVDLEYRVAVADADAGDELMHLVAVAMAAAAVSLNSLLVEHSSR